MGKGDSMSSLINIKDECSKCENIFQCTLTIQGHGIRCERSNVAEMVACQLEHHERKRGISEHD